MNPEMAAMRNIDRNREKRVELSPLMERAYDKARVEVLTHPDHVISEKEFEGTYDSASIASDIAEADRLEKKFAENKTQQEMNSKKIADVLEAVILMQSEVNNWLGENVSTLKTSRFDDYKNKVDMVAEWSSPTEGSRTLALAVDVTFGMQSIEKKLTEIRHEIDAGKLGEIRYFKDEKGDFMGRRRNVARTVIGISQPVVEELAGLWIENKNKALGGHPIQRVIIEQIYSQLEMMERYALKLGKHEIAQSYRQTRGVITKLRAEKFGIPVGVLKEDPVAIEIADQTRLQFS